MPVDSDELARARSLVREARRLRGYFLRRLLVEGRTLDEMREVFCQFAAHRRLERRYLRWVAENYALNRAIADCPPDQSN